MRFLAIPTAALALAGCSSGLVRPVHEVTARAGADGVQRVTLTAHSFYFEPSRIVVRARVPVELAVHNAAWLTPHDFICDAPEGGIRVRKPLSWLHGTRRVRFIPTRPGEYPFYCGVDAHMRKGMTGTIVVVP
ncbi:MAG: cupredoxin domain-containing protein [Candidatus Eisenbacteria bacterium]|nr:cupredoxin domain-containing protein [Candidatus Eisenbacteria bacterium]